MQTNIDALAARLRLSPYQTYVLAQNGYKYNLNKVKKIGDMVYAPYRCDSARGFWDEIEKILFGPRADLIGADRMIAYDRRRINTREFADRA
jgi:hypothetical protein